MGTENENIKEDNKSVFEIDTLVAETFNKIAAWHNDDSTSAGLKQLSLEIVENICTEAFKNIGLNSNLSIYKDEKTEELKQKERDKN
ncbi:MAG TPA: hypothetical protein VMZ91_08520 [Candidatus Paceibacterota bacterium]|nr:hypothetical protein [Candidatus Paceibacterota bacterium]